MDIIKARCIVQSQIGTPIQIAKAQCPTPVDATDIANKDYVDARASYLWEPSRVDLSFTGAGTTPFMVTANISKCGTIRGIMVPAFSFVPTNNTPLVASSAQLAVDHSSGSPVVFTTDNGPQYAPCYCLMTSANGGTITVSADQHSGWSPGEGNTVHIKNFSCWWAAPVIQ